jgi:hypothetical protein
MFRFYFNFHQKEKFKSFQSIKGINIFPENLKNHNKVDFHPTHFLTRNPRILQKVWSLIEKDRREGTLFHVAGKAKLGYDICLLRWVEIHPNIHKENRQKVIMVENTFV